MKTLIKKVLISILVTEVVLLASMPVIHWLCDNEPFVAFWTELWK